jgi:hypothetical protein
VLKGTRGEVNDIPMIVTPSYRKRTISELF